jgi:predicted DNA-binding protein
MISRGDYMKNILLRGLSEEEKKALEILASHNKRSLNSEILVAIDKYLEDDENYLIVKEYLQNNK